MVIRKANRHGLMLHLLNGAMEKQKGFTGMYRSKIEGADIVHDVESFPWPFTDDECHVIIAPHVAEHIKPWLIYRFFDECWRILKEEGQLAVSVPYAGSPGFWSDPSHCTGFNERSFAYLDPDYPDSYNSHKPKPWKIEKGNPIWQVNGNLECLLRPKK